MIKLKGLLKQESISKTIEVKTESISKTIEVKTESISKTIEVGAHFGNWVIIKIQSAKDAMQLDRGGVITLKNIVSGDVMPVQSDSGQWKATLHQQVMTDSTAIGLLNQIANNNKN